MQEYKRERNTLEGKLNDLVKKAAFHDDHIRTIDAWFGQVRLCKGHRTGFMEDLIFSSYWTN